MTGLTNLCCVYVRRRLATGNSSIVTTYAIGDKTGMVWCGSGESRRRPRNGTVADIAVLDSNNMGWPLALRNKAVMTI